MSLGDQEGLTINHPYQAGGMAHGVKATRYISMTICLQMPRTYIKARHGDGNACNPSAVMGRDKRLTGVCQPNFRLSEGMSVGNSQIQDSSTVLHILK